MSDLMQARRRSSPKAGGGTSRLRAGALRFCPEGREHFSPCSASVTIYLSLVLLLVLALIFTLTESARVSYIKARLRSITYMAEDSVFSEFAQPVFDDYGVMMLWRSEEDFLERFRYYADSNLKTSPVNSLIYTDLCRAGLTGCTVSDIITPLDNGGEVFAGQVYEYMNYYLAEDAASRILEHVSIFDQGGKVDDFMDRIEKFADTFRKVEKAVGKVRDRINKAKAIAKDPASLLTEAQEYLDAFNEDADGAASGFARAISELRRARDSLKSRLEDVRQAADEYYECVRSAKDAVDQLEEMLELDRDEFDDDIYEVVEEQVNDLKQKSADTDFDYYLVGENNDITSDYINRLDRLDYLFDDTSAELSSENAGEYRDLISHYRDMFSDFNLDGLHVNYDDSEVEKEDDSFLDKITDFFEAGILGFVAGDVSDKTVSTEELPSSDRGEAESGKGENLLEASLHKAIFGEYILTHFGNCAENDGDGALDYEAEYILSGKSSDRDNLAAAVAEIVLIRTGLNLISLLKSTAKKAETYALATSLAGFTGMPIVIKIVQILVMAAWALAESMADVRALIGGHKVKTIKADEDWYLSLSGIKNFGEDSLSSSGNERGLTYESYLRVLLLAQNRTDQYYRTMDMIQADMCHNENEAFRISQCITGATVNAVYGAQPLFTDFSFVKKVLGEDAPGYTFNIIQQFSY